MPALRLIIEEKIREEPFGIASLDHFKYRDGEEIDPRVVVEQAALSLYCLDHDSQRAIFVETPPDVDLSRAPFYFQAQYDSAQSLVAVSYETLHALAGNVQIDPSRIMLVYSTGRCGSTLISHALNQATGVYGFAEPDAFTQLVSLRAFDRSNDSIVAPLVKDCTTIMCAAAQSRGASSWAFKFRSYVVELSDLLYRSFPEAKVVFLYRNAGGWAKSFVRAFEMGEDRAEWAQQFWSSLIPRVGAYTAMHSTTMPFLELLACPWVSTMERCSDLQRQNVSMFCARYEDLKVAPREVIDAMFAYCGITVGHPEELDRVLVHDSQAGTTASQVQARRSRSTLTDQDLAEFKRHIQRYAPDLSSDTILPQTYRPSRSLD